jgi:hypothetical protein
MRRCAHEYAAASEPTLAAPSMVLQAIKGLKDGKAPGPNGTPNKVPRHLPKREITILMKVFNAVLRRQYLPPAWKRSHCTHTEAGEGFHAVLFVQTHECSGQCWKTL